MSQLHVTSDAPRPRPTRHHGRLPSLTLEYDSASPRHRNRTRFIQVSAAIALLALIWTCGKPLWLRAQIHYYQSRCWTYAAPAQTVVADFSERDIRGMVPAEWQAFYRLSSPPGLLSHGTLFLHERRTPSGERRLVAVDIRSGNASHFFATVRLFEPSSIAGVTREVLNGRQYDYRFVSPHRICAGQPDPLDPTHFTIEMDWWGHGNRIMDGWLTEDDRVLLELRPLANQPTVIASP